MRSTKIKLSIVTLGMVILFSSIISPISPTYAVSDGTAVVVSTSQDYDIAKLLSDTLDVPLVIVEWGKIAPDDLESIKSFKPERMIIVGGTIAVPDEIEKIGIPFERFGGGNRIATINLVMERFFNFSTNGNYILPGKAEFTDFLENSGERTAIVVPGNSPVSHRWGRYYGSKLGDYFKKTYVLDGSNPAGPTDLISLTDLTEFIEKNNITTPVVIATGNPGNNPVIKSNWQKTGAVKEAAALPLVYLLKHDDADYIFITGTDQNIFYNQKSLEKIGIVRPDPRGLLFFGFVFLLVLLLLFHIEKDPRFRLLSSALLLVGSFFYIRKIFGAATIGWDSLYVYFDGALSLYYLGQYETISDVKALPGMSFITYAFFLFTGVKDFNAHLLSIVFLLLIVVSVHGLARKRYGSLTGFLLSLTIISNPYILDYTLEFGSDIPFVAMSIFSFYGITTFKNKLRYVFYLLLFYSLLIKPIGLLLVFAIYFFYFERKGLANLLGLALPSFLFLGLLDRNIKGYINELEIFQYLNPSDIVGYMAQYALGLLIILNPFIALLVLSKLVEFKRLDGMEKTVLYYSGFVFLSVSIWIYFSLRYLLPIIPFLVLLAGSRTNKHQNKLLVLAALFNLALIISGYRFDFFNEGYLNFE